MVKVGLQLNANLDNIDELKTCYPNYAFYVKLKCTNCGESTDKWHDITESEKIQHNTRSVGFNFYMKCKMCGRENTIDIVEGSNCAYTAEYSGMFKTIVAFDCRGVEPFDFSPRAGWIVKASDNGPSFENVDLSEDDWVEYDQKNQVSIGVYDFKSNFVKLKK